ncbi:alpha/beta fold hydrolase [Phototrophicus methaneseepsis]|uniref:Alpha/beta fold hydrolase n=1 Tax=Phototrophicus methaneseepsis TaxID=2710758 RepID=A0A7S8E787_9CHLR|nr:alpha/beta fold hydrolase [Phototrophicus methaneseepsis]QPC81652.1 alpha/beta fold hydrolase [Phototrophicus methaneseepsis]
MKSRMLFISGLLLVLLGSLLAWNANTDGGTIEIKDVRFMGTNGTQMSALLYIPPNATAETPAPAILAIHGYINSRETQAGYAIEFARRGYVVLALDQTGHGYSDPPAFGNGFGGPDGLAYLRTLDIVDTDNIGLEGHSMGGWASVIAAGVYPDDYKAIMLQGSSTGTFGAPDGTAEFPRNLGVVFSTWDEFSELMWNSPTGTGVTETEKLQTAFGTDEEVVVGQMYGSIEDGTARQLYQPTTTHPGDHLNSEAIGDAVEWMSMTLEGGNGLDPSNQIWQMNEIGRLIALVGMVLAMLGFGRMLLSTPYFIDLVRPIPAAKTMTGPAKWVGYLLTIFIPIVTYFWLQNLPTQLGMSASAFFPQNITTGIMFWAVGNGIISLILFLLWHFTSNRSSNATIENYALGGGISVIFKSFVLALSIFAFGYFLLVLAGMIFTVDFRFWVVAIKQMSGLQFRIFLQYLPFFTFFFLVLGLALHGQLRPTRSDGSPVGLGYEMLAYVGLLVLGFFVLLAVQYIPLMTGSPLPFGESLLTVVAFQFIPLLTIVGAFMAWFFRKTGTLYTGAFLSAMFITWVIVAGQATHFAF